MRSFSRTCAAPAMRHPRSFGPVRAPRVRRPAAIVGLPATAIVLLRNLFIGAAPMTWLGIVVLTLGVGAWLMDRDHKRKLKDCEEVLEARHEDHDGWQGRIHEGPAERARCTEGSR